MKIGVALPSNLPGAKAADLIDWARRADAAPFTSLANNDRIAYVTYDPLVMLAMAAGVTTRVRLLTNILIAPIRNPGVLATQAAGIDALSNGRLTLGLAVGSREDDYLVGGAPYRNRGKRLDEMFVHMKRVWAGETFAGDSHPSGPPPVQQAGPELLIGGAAPAAIARVGKYADGFIVGGGGNLDRVREVFDSVVESWKANDRSGQPRFVSQVSYALGNDDVIQTARDNQYAYYEWLGDRIATARADGIHTTPVAIRDTIAGLESVGVDEVILQPTHPAPHQLDRAIMAVF